MTASALDHDVLEALREAVRDLGDAVERHESDGTFPRAAFEAVFASGIAELVVDPPESVAAPARLFCAGLEVVAGSWLALGESAHLQTLIALTVARNAAEPVRSELVPRMITGELIASNCVSEEHAGSDMGAIEVSATRDGDVFRLDGTKTWAGHAPVAGLLIVYARTSNAGLGGITCFAVDVPSPGITVGPSLHKRSAAALPSADIRFDDVPVPAERMLGRLNRGVRVAESMFTQGRVGLAACAVGLAQAALDRAVDYAKTRVQFGVPIIRHQAVSFLLADMSTRLAAARQLLYRAADELDAGGPDAELLAAQAKLFATDAAMAITTDAVQVLGAAAYRPGEAAERWLREAKLLQIIQGTNQIQRQAVAARL